ncbi:MAG TPA: hypothetical protein VNZ53_53720 [Steroidobacteraceae bacterium]|jgi:hypothetical protein|nr:hypothetical protein [Steroidobacteraceae bacterium]
MIGVEKIIEERPSTVPHANFGLLFAAGNEEAEMPARLLCIGAQPASVAIAWETFKSGGHRRASVSSREV